MHLRRTAHARSHAILAGCFEGQTRSLGEELGVGLTLVHFAAGFRSIFHSPWVGLCASPCANAPQDIYRGRGNGWWIYGLSQGGRDDALGGWRGDVVIPKSLLQG